MARDALKAYCAKRDFSKTAEPSGDAASSGGKGARGKVGKGREKAPDLLSAARANGGGRYLIQKHAATRLHYDFRLEHDGVLWSWAVTRGPSRDPHDKRLAVHVEDHPLEYGDFEGTIPKGQYGGGTVMLWDEGTWEPVEDPDRGMAEGKLKFVLHGNRLTGGWTLVKIRNKRPGDKNDSWLLIKERDEAAIEGGEPLTAEDLPSIRTGRSMAEIAAGDLEWTREGARRKSSSDTATAPEAATTAEPRPRRSRRRPGEKPPAFVDPQRATLVDEAPEGEGWLHEIKHDGYRALAALGGGEVILYTRNKLDWTQRFSPLVAPLATLPADSALIDGEVCVLDAEGRADFGLLQAALSEGGKGIGYYAFDLLFLDGRDLRNLPLVERKQELKQLLAAVPASGPLFYSDHVLGHGGDMFREACALGVEGIVSKQANAPYRSGRTRSWLKVKCGMGQEFVVIGWEPSAVKGKRFSSLLLAVRDPEGFSYKGKVGSGYSMATQEAVWSELAQRPAKEPAAHDVPREVRRKAKFVRPELVAEIAFRGWSRDGLIRQGSFKGLRRDKPPNAVVEEKPASIEAEINSGNSPDQPGKAKTANRSGGKSPAEPARPAAPARAKRNAGPKEAKGEARPATIEIDRREAGEIEIAGVRISHPDRVIFPGRNVTKRSLAEYYVAVADRILPHVARRPLSLVRCPRGQGGDCFFQKHASPGFPEEFRPIRIKEKSGTDTYLYVEDVSGLVAAVQMGVLELHIWGSQIADLERPDRLVFDLDPDEAVPFASVKEGARQMRDRLAALGLTSFPMVTGGKGIHVVVPLTPRHGWDEIRTFAEAMARMVAAEEPERYLAVMSKARRKGRIFIDYLRNARGATAIAPFSSRARGGAPIAAPVSWAALGRLQDAHPIAVDTAVAALAKERRDPWSGYFDVDQVLPLERLANG